MKNNKVGRGRRLIPPVIPVFKKEDWTIFSVWDPTQLKDISDKGSRKEYSDVLKKSFFGFQDEDLHLDLEEIVLVVKIMNKNIKMDVDKSLTINGQIVMFGETMATHTHTELVCKGRLAEILTGIISTSDVLVLNVLPPYIRMTLSRNQKMMDRERKFQIIRIPQTNNELEEPLLLIEKVKPYLGEILSIKYVALDREANLHKIWDRYRRFNLEQQSFEINNPSRLVEDVYNPGFFCMPMHKFMCPKTIFDFLITFEDIRRGRNRLEEVDKRDDTKEDTVLLKSMYSSGNKDIVDKKPWKWLVYLVLFGLGLLACYLYFDIFSSEEEDLAGTPNESSLTKSEENTALSLVYEWDNIGNEFVKWLLSLIFFTLDFTMSMLTRSLETINCVFQ